MRAYVDSDILIWHLRGEGRAAALLRKLSAEPGTELWTGALQRAEVVFFMRPAERPATMSFLSRFRTAPVTQEIDAILAATAIATSGKIYTQNVKHYPMPDLRLVRGW